MESTDNKIYTSESDNELVIIVPAKVEQWKEHLLTVWFLAWSFCGILIFSQLFEDHPKETKLFMVVYLFFWIYFEIKTGHAWLWRKWGKELIKIDDESLVYKRDIKSYGTAYTYYKDNIKNLRKVTYPERSFAKIFNDSFWIVGGETVGFDYLGKEIALGMQLDDEKAGRLLSLIKKRITRKYPAPTE